MPKVTDTPGTSTPIEDASLAMLSDHALRLFLNAAEREERDMCDWFNETVVPNLPMSVSQEVTELHSTHQP